MGRPTSYTEEVVEKARDYIDNFESYGDALPSVVGLCRVIERAKSTVYEWAKDSEKEFSDILEAINENQERVAFNKGLTGDYNASLVKLLMGKHGYHDKVDSNNQHSGAVKHEVNIGLVPKGRDD